MAAAGYMVITGAASAASWRRATSAPAAKIASASTSCCRSSSSANPVILGDPKLMHLQVLLHAQAGLREGVRRRRPLPRRLRHARRRLRGADARADRQEPSFPSSGRRARRDYWKMWQGFIEEALVKPGYISASDRAMYKITDRVDEAVKEVTQFYRVYHSMRYVQAGPGAAAELEAEHGNAGEAEPGVRGHHRRRKLRSRRTRNPAEANEPHDLAPAAVEVPLRPPQPRPPAAC